MRVVGVIHLGTASPSTTPSSSSSSSSSLSYSSAVPRSLSVPAPVAIEVAAPIAFEEKKSGAPVKPLEHLVLEQTSSCVVMPPWQHWKPFVDLKQRHMKPSIKRPPYPHITMFAPFAAKQDFGEVPSFFFGFVCLFVCLFVVYLLRL